MPLRYQTRFTRPGLQENPAALYAFGDNLAGTGLGGQAKECRGEPNAVGIPTKRYPGQAEADYLTDQDFAEWHAAAMPRLSSLADHLRAGGLVVWPAAGIGTGLAELATRAPRIWACLERARERLDTLGIEHAPIAAADHPFVRRALAAFPGATIVSVRKVDRD